MNALSNPASFVSTLWPRSGRLLALVFWAFGGCLLRSGGWCFGFEVESWRRTYKTSRSFKQSFMQRQGRQQRYVQVFTVTDCTKLYTCNDKTWPYDLGFWLPNAWGWGKLVNDLPNAWGRGKLVRASLNSRSSCTSLMLHLTFSTRSEEYDPITSWINSPTFCR